MAMRWTSVIAALGLALAALGPALVAPAAALGDGGSVLPVQGGNGITVPGSQFRYVVVAAGRDTVIKRLPVGGGRADAAIRVSGHYGIPGVDASGGLTGLSADGRTLVLAQITMNAVPRSMRVLVLDAPRLTVRATIALRGWATVDAISPNGRWLYLIEYQNSNVGNYSVRAYDLRAHRLLAEPIVDPHDRDEAMTGFPITRVTSADGRWDYTLYDRPSGPFVHALDTVGRRAVCVDLPRSVEPDIGYGRLELGSGGATVRIAINGVTDATVDTRTFAVTTGPADATPAPIIRPVAQSVRPVPHTGSGGGFPWELVAAAALAVLGGAVRLRGGLRIS
jgi:hypothetical protein